MVSYFDRQAREWDGFLSPRTTSHAIQAIERAGIHPGCSVLDVGAANGFLLPHLKRYGCTLYVGLELSTEMIKVFRSRHRTERILQADFEEGPDIDVVFDYVVVFNTFALFDDPRGAFRNARRYLVRGGAFVIENSPPRRELARWRREHNVRQPYLPDDEELESMCCDAGFAAPEVDDTDFFYCSARAL